MDSKYSSLAQSAQPLHESPAHTFKKKKANIAIAITTAIVLITLALHSPGFTCHHSIFHHVQTHSVLEQLSDEFHTGRTSHGPPGRHADMNPDPSHLFVGNKAAVACDVPICSTIAANILARGGSAVDAAVTTALCIGTINSFSSGIGGGGFMTVRHPNGTSSAFNFREKAPRLAHKHMYDGKRRMLSRVGGLAVGIPGEIAGLEAAFNMYTSGELSWKELFDPIIELNKKGFEVAEPLEMASNYTKSVILANRDQWDWLIVDEEGKQKSAPRTVLQGELVLRPNYARTLELIADHGAKIFYDPKGPIAPHLVNTIRLNGGIATLEDFADYDIVVSDTIKTEFMGREVLTVPNPSSGPVLLMALNILNGFNDTIEEKDFSPIATQRLIEIMKWMAAGRTELGDIADELNGARIEELMTPEWADAVRKNISDDHTFPWQSYKPRYEPQEPHGTSHFSIIDENGMAVSMTTTVNLLFGALISDPITGVVLNSEMDDFSQPHTDNAFRLHPSIFNFAGPSRRPLSSCVPTIISKDGVPELIIGAAGGSRIPTAVFQAIVRILRYEESLLYSIAAPRFHHQLLPDELSLEYEGPEEIIQQLRSRGHHADFSLPATAMNGIQRLLDIGKVHAVSDYWRKMGRADGY